MTASRRIPIAILASGRGTNFEKIVRATQRGELHAEVKVLVCDRTKAPVLELAKELGIQTVCVPRPFVHAGTPIEKVREMHEEALIGAIRPFSPHFLVMAGYMRIVTPRLLQEFRSPRGYSRIVNIHPSLLPAFPGLDAYAQAYRYGAKLAGVTVHLVDEDMDSGPICAQEAFSISDCGSEREVEERGLAIEHRLYPSALSWVLPERFEVEARERRLCVRSS